MPHQLLRLAEKVYNNPLLISPMSLDPILGYLEDRNFGDAELAIQPTRPSRLDDLCYSPDTQIGILSVAGPLTYKPTLYSALCGGVSYQGLQADFETMARAGAKVVVLDADSGGGEAYGCFETANALRQLADQHGIKLLAYVDGLAASACYALIGVCDEVIANPMAEIGSIGVVVKLRNTTKAMREAGIEDTYIYAGNAKVSLDDQGEFKPGFLAGIQAKVNALYQMFAEHISANRNIPTASIRDMEAKLFSASDAAARGLVDQLMTREQFFTYLSELPTIKQPMFTRKSNTTLQTNEPTAELQELQAELQSVQQELETSAASLVAAEQLNAALATENEQLKAALKTHLDAETAAKMQARSDRLSKCLDQEKAAGVFASTQELSDTAFDLVAQSFEAVAEVQSQTDAFKELGHADESQPKSNDAVLGILQNQYKNKNA